MIEDIIQGIQVHFFHGSSDLNINYMYMYVNHNILNAMEECFHCKLKYNPGAIDTPNRK